MAQEQNINNSISQPVGGMDLVSIPSQIKKGFTSFSLNSVIENFDGKQVAIQNEGANVICAYLPAGFKVIGVKPIYEIKQTLYWVVNPLTGACEIGYVNDGMCTYNTYISSPCLGFDRNFPIKTIEVKTTNCSTQVYWTDANNDRRFIDLNDLPWKEEIDPNNDFKRIKIEGVVDCNKLLVQPKFTVPVIKPISVDIGGSLIYGTYQFFFQYSNALGEGATSFYSNTNGVSIKDNKITPNFNETTSKSINVNIDNIDTSGLYDHFNLVVLETINLIPTPKLVGTFPITARTFSYNYTGNTKTQINLAIADLFEKFPYYDIAAGVTSADNSLIFYGLTSRKKDIYQSIWSKVKFVWETWKIPYNEFEAYNNGVNTANIKGHFRDEVYALEAIITHTDGSESMSFPLVGRKSTSYDTEIISIQNLDAAAIKRNPCEDPQPTVRWKVYNTASRTGYSEQYLLSGQGNDCYVGPYEYGEFAYWESQDPYPNNPLIWGALAGKPIRHFKFPDCAVSPIHDNNINNDPNFIHSIYPIGIKIDLPSLYRAIEESDLTEEQRGRIAGFKIVRANRANNKSVVAKGLLYNVGKYEKNEQTYLYPNYPYNDLNPDVFISNTKVSNHSGNNSDKRLDGFNTEDSKQRFTFHSPDTHFYQPNFVDSGYLKLETVEYGKTRSHFIEVQDNAKYKFLTSQSLFIAYALGLSSALNLDSGGGFLGIAPSVTVDIGPIASVFTASLQILKDIAQAKNYGYQYNSIGNYNNSLPVPNEQGIKNRPIETGRYLIEGVQSVNDIYQVNNKFRESSVYLKTSETFPFPHEVDTYLIPEDNSRYILSDSSTCDSPETVIERNISSFYGAIKRYVPDQYGRIFSYEVVDTGFLTPLYDEKGAKLKSVPTIFGGDCFINRIGLKRKHSFFLASTVKKDNEYDISLDQIPTVGYPTFYYSTSKIDTDVDFSNLQGYINNIIDTSAGTIIINILSGGVRPLTSGLMIFTTILKAYVESLGVANVNLDCPASPKNLTEEGKVYLFAYGIPYFFCESEVNVDYRQATNSKEGNFFPNVATDIPDDWLQEVNVPILLDNSYTYNQTYSKQNKENVFTHLREDYDPSKTCLFEFPNRAIYSDKSTLEETKNNWLVYRPVSFFDFPKEYGPLAALNGFENRQVLARFENKSLIYNALSTVNTSTLTAYLGNDQFFKSSPPLDFAETDLGFAGSQHKFFIKTEFGHITIDAKRGQIFILKGNTIDTLSNQYTDNWFQEYLPFKITNYFPTVDIDNNFKGLGLHGTYDAKYKRILITKLDYEPLNTEIKYIDSKFTLDGTEVSLQDSTLFCNRSWTLSYSFIPGINNWVSFHSYQPNYYISQPTYFQSGLNSDGSIWSHNTVYNKFNNFYGKIYPYIIEHPYFFENPNDQILQYVKDYTTALKYTDFYTYTEPDKTIYFNKAIIDNGQQCTGLLNLVPNDRNNLSQKLKYPKYNSISKDILVTKVKNYFNYNTFWDIVKNNDQPIYLKSCDFSLTNKELNSSNLDYGKKDFAKAKIMGKDLKVRHILDNQDNYKLITHFNLVQTQTSFT